jgi:ABC-type oligopeptide transport system substrate-binding subunit
LAAMELFSKENPENYIHLKDDGFEKILAELRTATSESARKNACRRSSEYLIDQHRIVPMGELYFTMLINPRFRDWDLNELNQLDLTDLRDVGN